MARGGHRSDVEVIIGRDDNLVAVHGLLRDVGVQAVLLAQRVDEELFSSARSAAGSSGYWMDRPALYWRSIST